MAEAPLIGKYEELAGLAGHSYDQYMGNGFAKFLTAICNPLAKHSDLDIILTGSTTDGSKVDGSDVDVMICPRSVTLDETRFKYNDKCPCYFQVPSEKVNGNLKENISTDGEYLDAKSLKSFPKNLFNLFGVIRNFMQMNNALCPSTVGYVFSAANRDDPQSKSRETYIEPPIDFVPALQISGCRNYMAAWLSRNREWPTSDIVESIKRGKLYAVAKVSPLNGDEEKDFCLSFTVAEKTLMTSMSDEQLLCMRILKLVRSKLQSLLEHSKRYDEADDKEATVEQTTKDIFTSYLFKTALFWTSETMNPSSWTDTEGCVRAVLGYFQDCLQRRHFPHYFVPSMNLLTGIPERNIKLASKELHKFVTSDASTHEAVIANSLNKVFNTSSSTNPPETIRSTGQCLQTLVKSGFEMSEVFMKRDEVDRKSDLTSGCQDAANLFHEFLRPWILLEEKNRHEGKGNRRTEHRSPSPFTLSARNQKTIETQSLNVQQKYRHFNSKLTKCGKHTPGSMFATLAEKILSVSASPNQKRDEFWLTDWLTDLSSVFPMLLKSENANQDDRCDVPDELQQPPRDGSGDPYCNDSVNGLLVGDIEMDIELD